MNQFLVLWMKERIDLQPWLRVDVYEIEIANKQDSTMDVLMFYEMSSLLMNLLQDSSGNS